MSFTPDLCICQVSSDITLLQLENLYDESVRILPLLKTIDEFSFPHITNKLKKSKFSLS